VVTTEEMSRAMNEPPEDTPETDKGRGRRTPFAIIAASPALSFVFIAAILQNAGMSICVPSLALQLESMSASPQLLGYVAAAAPLVSVRKEFHRLNKLPDF
jgi:hypothetical protein